ncbi:hypothetical protein RIF29_38933 [Crotalaria pallida]|uniref:Reverse transcriptase domain-containing protein n=1 Tax=Crotalaria pallida TaxID=3830 RepID=A0AAN9E0X1_CROPI
MEIDMLNSSALEPNMKMEGAHPDMTDPTGQLSNIVIIQEPRCSGDRAKQIIKKLGFRNSLISEAIGYVGGIWTLWNNDDIKSNSSKEKLNLFICQSRKVTSIIGQIGGLYTWRGPIRNGYDRAYKRLDRGLCNVRWRTRFPYVVIKVLARVHYDHNPLCLNLQLNSRNNHARPFRFHAIPSIICNIYNPDNHCDLANLGLSPNAEEIRKAIRAINSTLLVLIPKVDTPQWASQFRPIALCNVVYKRITKILANRLNPFLNNWISPNQAGFVSGRNIQDNIIIAQELVHTMKNMRGKKGFMSIKFDLEKAYDRLSWDFVRKCLMELNLPAAFVELVYSCNSTTSFKILWNWDKTDSFLPSRGIRQGDSLSPFLFVICMDKLAHMITDERLQWINLVLKGNGRGTLFWKDKWLGDNSTLEDWALNVIDLFNDFTLVKDMADVDDNWNYTLLQNLLTQYAIDKISCIPPPRDEMGNDNLIWEGTNNGVFSVKHAYSLINSEPPRAEVIPRDDVWKTKCPEIWKFFLWKAGHNQILTNSRKAKWGLGSADCIWCNGVEETALHARRDCPKAQHLWTSLIDHENLFEFFNFDLFSWIRRNLNTGWGVQDLDNRRKGNILTRKETIFIQWRGPLEGWVKLNTNGASKGNPGLAWCGGVFRDDRGKWSLDFTAKLGSLQLILRTVGNLVGSQCCLVKRN